MRVSRSRLLMATSAVALMAAAGATTAHAATSAAGGGFPGTAAAELFGDGTVDLPTGNTGTVTLTLAGNLPATTLWDITLTNGATWGAALATGDVNAADCLTAVTVSFTSGGADTSSDVTIRLQTDNNSCTTGDTIGFTFGIDGATALNTPGQQVLATTTLRDNISTVDGGVTDSPITLVTSVDGTVVTGATSGTPVVSIDVTTGSTLFVTSAGVATDDAVLGSINITDDATADEDDLATAWVHGAGDATVTGATVTVTGDFSAGLGATPGTCTLGVYLDASADSACQLAEQADTLSATTAVFNLTNAEFAALASDNLRMAVDGTTAIANQTVTAVARSNWANGAYQDETTAAQTLNQLQRNGFSNTTNFWTSAADNTAGFISAMRIKNNSSVDGRLFVQLIPDGGTASAATPVPDTFAGMTTGNILAAGDAVELTNADIETITGTTIASGLRGQVVVTGEFTSTGGIVNEYFINPNSTVTDIQ